jgi:hypothetical protein
MPVLRAIWRGWMAFARVLGRVNTTLVLTIIYFLILPLFAPWRLKDPLRLRLSSGQDGGKTYWLERAAASEPEPLERFLLPR